MVIPRQAVLENQGKSFVYVIAQDSRARMVPVATAGRQAVMTALPNHQRDYPESRLSATQHGPYPAAWPSHQHRT